MRKELFLLAACLFTAIMTGCSVNEDGIYGSFPYIKIDESTVTLSKVGQSHPIPYESNRNLKTSVESKDGNWLTAGIQSGELILTYKDNELERERNATVTISTPNGIVTKTIKVVQDASGELTINNDLILRSKSLIKDNTYTKTTGNLIVGNVELIKSKATTEKETINFNDGTLSASPSDIDDSDMEIVTEQIHMVGSRTLAIINTEVTEFPADLMIANEIENLYFAYNEMRSLPEASVMKSLNLNMLSIEGNDISDISALEDCEDLTYLNIAETGVYDLSPILDMRNLETVVMNGIPVSKPQLDVFLERCDKNIIAEGIDTDGAVVPIISNIEIEELGDNKIRLTAQVTRNGGNSISKVGFYIGSTRLVDEMYFHETTIGSDGKFTIDYQAETLMDNVYHVRAAAINSNGEGFSNASHFGSLISDEDIILKSIDELSVFYQSSYSHVNGSVYLGAIKYYDNGGILLEGNEDMYFGSMELKDLSQLSGLVYVRDGIYIGNTTINSISHIAHIEGVQTLWLKGNRISKIPELECSATLTSLDVSRNALTDFSFLENLPNIEKLYLGDSNKPLMETNDIGILTGLEKHTNIKHLDLSGLPLHKFQVDDLKELMPECEIVFKSGNKDPHLPTVSAGSFVKGDQKATLSAYVVRKGKSDIIEHGFYFGKDIDNLEKHKVGDEIDVNTTFSLDVDIYDEDIYYFYPYAVNSLGETRTAPTEFSLAYEDLCEFGTANCYIVTAEGKYRFNATVKGYSSEQIHPASVDVLWETRHTYMPFETGAIISSIELVGGEVEFETTGQEGNALIAVKDDAGVILWSWHIWVTDQPGTHDWVSQHGTFTVMDRNLGATRNDRGSGDQWREASGTLYQLGRKDPFLYDESAGFNRFNYLPTIEQTVQNPATFSGTNGDWWNSEKLDGLWDPDTKTIWDPCPPGYMVASYNAYESAAHDGWDWDYGRHIMYNTYNGGKDKAWVPASLYIDCWGNCVWNDGKDGQIRTSGPNEWTHNKYTMMYNADGVFWNEPSAGDALPVRCMRMSETFVVQTMVPTSSETSITANGILILNMDVDIEEKGFLISDDNTVPTLSSNDGQVVASDTSKGSFSCIFTDLKPNTTYMVVAYATGNGTTRYGEAIRVNTASPGSGEGFTGDDFEW